MQVELIIFLANFIIIFKDIIVYSIIARILMSWLTMGTGKRPSGRLYQFLYDSTEPMISMARRVPHKMGMIDFAPLIAMFVVDMGGQFIAKLLISLVS